MYREKLKDGTTVIRGNGAGSAWPVSSIYLSMDPRNPSTLFGGTWVRLAQGRMLVGVDESDPTWDTVGDIGGEKTHLLTATEIPEHRHAFGVPAAVMSTSGYTHDHGYSRKEEPGGGTGAAAGNSVDTSGGNTSDDTHDHSVTYPGHLGNTTNVGGSEPHNNLPPFLAVYIWRRTA